VRRRRHVIKVGDIWTGRRAGRGRSSSGSRRGRRAVYMEYCGLTNTPKATWVRLVLGSGIIQGSVGYMLDYFQSKEGCGCENPWVETRNIGTYLLSCSFPRDLAFLLSLRYVV